MRWLLAAVLVMGCGGGVTARLVMAPDGHGAALVTCQWTYACLNRAEELCPGGYDAVDAPGDKVLHATQMLITCKRP